MEWNFHKKPSALGLASGLVAGLVVNTPPRLRNPAWSLVMASRRSDLLLRRAHQAQTQIYDSLDGVGVHVVGGTFGAICRVFSPPSADGLIYGGGDQFLKQLAGWRQPRLRLRRHYVIALILDKTIGLRVDEEAERWFATASSTARWDTLLVLAA